MEARADRLRPSSARALVQRGWRVRRRPVVSLGLLQQLRDSTDAPRRYARVRVSAGVERARAGDRETRSALRGNSRTIDLARRYVPADWTLAGVSLRRVSVAW